MTTDSPAIDSEPAASGGPEPDVPGPDAARADPGAAEPAGARPDHPDIERVLLTRAQIDERVTALAAAIDADYAGRELVLVAVLKGACMIMADLARALHTPVRLDFMAVSSYGSATSSSGVVRILKDLDTDISDADVLVVEDVIDSGLTLSWLLRNLRSRGPRSVEVVTLLRKPDAVRVPIDVRYVGFDIPADFVVGYGLDYAQRYRNLPYIGLLRPHVYAS